MRCVAFFIMAPFMAAFFATTTCAEDFTFNVPVELHNIPADIKTFGVSVAVYDKEKTSDGYWPPDAMIGYGSAGGTIVNGGYTGTLSVKFNVLPRRKPENAIAYEANLLLQGPPGYQGGCLNSMALDGPYPYDASKPIKCSASGPITIKPSIRSPLPTRPLRKLN